MDMPEWPEKPEDFIPALDGYDYERAMKEAALARLKCAMEALQRLSIGAERWEADEALADIGELPAER